MRAASTPLAAVFRTEVLFNLKRVAPYALMILFSGNALLWWGWGPAVSRGWAVNSEFHIVWLLCGFSFMTMPLFIAGMMGDRGGWLSNPVLYSLWTPADLAGGERLARILTHRVYCLALASFLLSLAFVLCERKSAGASKARGRFGGRARALLLAAASALVAWAAGFLVSRAG
jgi:hypothetical protein